jgi:hypothetical protein
MIFAADENHPPRCSMLGGLEWIDLNLLSDANL